MDIDKEVDRLRALGQKVDYKTTEINPKLLEVFESPMRLGAGLIEIKMERDEFTCLCPVTGQPDYGKIEIVYKPQKWCVESKSLKLYLMTFRNARVFHEEVAQRICNDLVNILRPEAVRVKFDAAPRGGIAFIPTAEYHMDDAF